MVWESEGCVTPTSSIYTMEMSSIAKGRVNEFGKIHSQARLACSSAFAHSVTVFSVLELLAWSSS